MKILGIDPGLERVGFGLIEVSAGHTAHRSAGAPKALDWGVIKTSKDNTEIERIAGIYRAIGQLLEQTKPDAACIERLFFFRNVTTMVPVSQARGVILLALHQAGVPFAEQTPLEIKMNLTGYGKASKQDIQEMMKQLLNLEEVPRPDDAADALAIAVSYTHAFLTIGPGRPTQSTSARSAKSGSRNIVPIVLNPDHAEHVSLKQH